MKFWETVRKDMIFMKIEKDNAWYMIKSFIIRLDFMAVFLFRVSSYFNDGNYISRVLSFLFWRLNVLINSCDIRPNAIIGAGFSLPHPMGVVVGVINAGNNLIIHQNVTIGRGQSCDLDNDMENRAKIGNDVIIYSGAVIVGKVRIEDNAVIGANAVVLSDVPKGNTAFAMPARNLPSKDS